VKYYVYFDRYRHPRKAVSEKELAEKYDNDPDVFLRAVCAIAPNDEVRQVVGHVGVMRFASEKELSDYFERTGEEISGFFECEGESRPYNF
jgi:hypothetical protein